MYRRAILAMGLALAAWSVPASEPSPAIAAAVRAMANRPLSVQPLNGGVYWVSGGVSNTGFIVGDDGVIVVDAQMFVPAAQKVLGEIAKITSLPVKEIILTHSDPDHVNGLPAYAAGTEIIAQENVTGEIQNALAEVNPGPGAAPAALKDYLPTRLVRNTESMVLDGVRVVLVHVSPAHTDADLIVYLPVQKIVFAGDLVTPEVGLYPVIHLEKHGSSSGWIKSMKAMLALDASTFISGHGAPQTRAMLWAN